MRHSVVPAEQLHTAYHGRGRSDARYGTGRSLCTASGIVLREAIIEGQHVTRGTALYTVSTDLQSVAGGRTHAALIAQALQRKTSLLHKIDKNRVLQQDARETLQAKLSSLGAELARVDEQLTSQRGRTAIAADGVTRNRRPHWITSRRTSSSSAKPSTLIRSRGCSACSASARTYYKRSKNPRANSRALHSSNRISSRHLSST